MPGKPNGRPRHTPQLLRTTEPPPRHTPLLEKSRFESSFSLQVTPTGAARPQKLGKDNGFDTHERHRAMRSIRGSNLRRQLIRGQLIRGQRQLGMESLESRRCLAVTAVVTSGNLVVS